MIENVIDAIVIALKREYPTMDVFTENIVQGLETPCFLVLSINPKNDRFLNNRYKQKHLIDVHYFPRGGRNEINTVFSNLFFTLEEVADLDGNTFRGSEMRTETVENVGHLLVQYNFFVDMFETREDPMEEISIKNNVRS